MISEANSSISGQGRGPAGISGGKAKVQDKAAFNIPTITRAITKIKKTCLTGRQVTIQTGALPLLWQKNLLKLAFSAPLSGFNYRSGAGRNYFYVSNNQLVTGVMIGRKGQFSWLKKVSTLFEFNKPISKKGAWISKDFEKNSTDFEGFRMDFEKYLKKPTELCFQLGHLG